MMLARWHVHARFGHKQAALDLLRKWESEIGPKAGIDRGSHRLLTGSIGARESEIQTEMQFEDLAAMQRFFDALGRMPEHAAWGKELEPYIVSGSNYFEVFRVLE